MWFSSFVTDSVWGNQSYTISPIMAFTSCHWPGNTLAAFRWEYRHLAHSVCLRVNCNCILWMRSISASCSNRKIGRNEGLQMNLADFFLFRWSIWQMKHIQTVHNIIFPDTSLPIWFSYSSALFRYFIATLAKKTRNSKYLNNLFDWTYK